MKTLSQILELLIVVGFGVASSGVIKGDARRYLDIGLDAVDAARKAFALGDILSDDNVTDEERQASQRMFDDAQARYRAKLAAS